MMVMATLSIVTDDKKQILGSDDGGENRYPVSGVGVLITIRVCHGQNEEVILKTWECLSNH